MAHCFIGGKKSSYTICFPSIKTAGHYYCQVQNIYGKVDSHPAKVTIKDQDCTSQADLES